MMPWIIAVSSYLVVGIALVFLGPAARLRRREREKLEWEVLVHNQPRWKLAAFSCFLALGIIAAWPVLLVSAAKAEKISKYGGDLAGSQTTTPSAEVDSIISDIQKRNPKSLSYSKYQEIRGKLSWINREQLDFRLQQLGYTVTGFVRDSDGQSLAAAIPVLTMGTPFALLNLRGKVGALQAVMERSEVGKLPQPDDWRLFSVPPHPCDEVWEFSSPPHSWEHLAGRAGIALVRDGVVVDTFVKVMN